MGETEALASENLNTASETKDFKENKVVPNESKEASKQIGADLDKDLHEKY